MAAPPYMKLYVGDYHGDTTHLTTVEHGAYLLLLMAMWRAGGKLPRDDKRIAALTKLSAAEWAEIKPTIMEFFQVSGGSFSHKRLVAEMSKYESVVEKRSKAGKASASKKASDNNDEASTHVEQVLNTCSHNQNHNQNHLKKDKTTSYLSSEFDDFWKQYPRKVGKGAALKAYAKARKENDHATLIGAVLAQRAWGIWTEERFIPHASTWLNEQRWLDERPKQTFGAKPPGNRSQPRSMAEIVLERQAARRREDDLSGDGWLQTGSNGLYVAGPDERESRASAGGRAIGFDAA